MPARKISAVVPLRSGGRARQTRAMGLLNIKASTVEKGVALAWGVHRDTSPRTIMVPGPVRSLFELHMYWMAFKLASIPFRV